MAQVNVFPTAVPWGTGIGSNLLSIPGTSIQKPLHLHTYPLFQWHTPAIINNDPAIRLSWGPDYENESCWGHLLLTTEQNNIAGRYSWVANFNGVGTQHSDMVLQATDRIDDLVLVTRSDSGKIRFATSLITNTDKERMTITPSGKIIINPSSQTINPLGKLDINLHPSQYELPKISFNFDDRINYTNPAICFYRSHSGIQTEAHTWRIEMDNPNYTNLSFKSYLGTIIPGSEDDINGTNDKITKLVEFQRDGTVIFSGPEPESYSNIWFPEGEGSRFVWARQKSAIRAGKVGSDYINEPDGSDYWNYDNIGSFSSSFGYNCQAKSPFSFSVGKDCKAGVNLNDKVSISIGLSCNSFDEAIAIGDHANAYGHNSLAIGKNCFSYGDYSTTMGNYSRTGSINLGYEGAFYIGDKNVDPNLFNDQNDIVYSSNLDNQLTLRFTGTGYDDLDIINPCMRLLTRKAYVNGIWEPVGMFLFHGWYGWVNNSDSNLKKNKQDVITLELLKNLRNVPIKTWQWINDSLYVPSSDSLQTGYYRIDSSSCRWLGPMSQDFYREIPYGIPDSTKICSSVIDGVLIASVQALADITDSLGLDLSNQMNKSSEVDNKIDSLLKKDEFERFKDTIYCYTKVCELVDNLEINKLSKQEFKNFKDSISCYADACKRIEELESIIFKLKEEIDSLKAKGGVIKDKHDNKLSVNNNIYDDIILEQNNPNPFSESCYINYYIPKKYSKTAKLVITDEFGIIYHQRIEICIGKPCQITISAKELNTGVYLYGIELAGQIVKSYKMMIIK